MATPKVIIRRIKARLGSRSKRGSILHNAEFMKAPLICIDYVITHEICRLKIHEHTPKPLSRPFPLHARLGTQDGQAGRDRAVIP